MKITHTKFNIGKTQVVVTHQELWDEYTFKFASGNWFRKFAPKHVTWDIPVIAREMLRKNYVEYLRRKEGA